MSYKGSQPILAEERFPGESLSAILSLRSTPLKSLERGYSNEAPVTTGSAKKTRAR
jgi:hypothetical protein